MIDTFTFNIILFLIFGHWIADFVFQSHWMASNKSKRFDALTYHVLVYSLIMTLFFVLTFLFKLNFLLILFIFAFLFITHWLTDAVTSRITSYLYAKQDYHNFFVVIGLDQVLHYLQIFGLLLILQG